MIAPTLINMLQNVIVTVVSGVLIQILPQWIPKPGSWPKFTIKSRIALSFTLAAAVFVLMYFFVNPAPKPTLDRTDQKDGPISPVPEVRIIQHQETGPTKPTDGSAQFDMKLVGYVTHWSGYVYPVVKPVHSEYWYIQPAAVTLGAAENGGTSWLGHAFYSTKAKGSGTPDSGEDFVIYAIATPTKYKGDEVLFAKPEGYESIPIYLTRHR